MKRLTGKTECSAALRPHRKEAGKKRCICFPKAQALFAKSASDFEQNKQR